jgi:O-antigen/teichoic acid export membrane protein
MSEILDTLKAKAVRGVFTLTFRRLVLKIIDTIGIITLARLLSQESFGVFGIVSFVVFTFLSFFSDVGFGAALIQKEEVSDDDLKTTFTIQQGLVTALLVIAWLVAPWVGQFYNLGDSGAWLVRILSLSLFITSFKTIPSIMLERKLRFELLIIPEIIETIAYNAIAIYMAFHGFGVWSLVIAVIVRTVLGAIALNVIAPWKIGWKVARQSARELLHFGVPFQLNSVLALIKDNITPTIIAVWYGPAAVGFVNVAQNISSRPMEISTIVSRITFPTYSRIQGDKERLKRWIEKSIHLMSVVYFPAIIGLIVTASPILQFLYADKSDKWLPALPTLLWFLVAAIPVVITTTYTNAIYATGHPKIVLALMFLYTTLTWGIGLPMIHYFGYVGIAVTVCVITYLTFPLVLYALRKVVIVDTFGMVWRPFVASLIMGGLVYVLRVSFVDGLWSLIAAIFAGLIIYSGVLYIIDGKYLKAELRGLIVSLLSRG